MLTTEKRNVPVNLDVFEGIPFSEIHALQIIQTPTPFEWIKTRETGYGQNKKQLSYVSGDTVIRILNKACNYRWSFEILQTIVVPSVDKLVVDKKNNTKEFIPQNPVVQCHGRMTIPGWGVREQWGAQIIVGGNETQEHAFKSASTDAMKKCASMFGIALDLYGTDGMFDLTTGPADYAYEDDTIIGKYKDKMRQAKEDMKPAVASQAEIPQRVSEDELIAAATNAALEETETVLETVAVPEPIVHTTVAVPEPFAAPIHTTVAVPEPARVAPVMEPEPIVDVDETVAALVAEGRFEEAATIKAEEMMPILDNTIAFDEVKASLYRDMVAKANRDAAAATAVPAPTPVPEPAPQAAPVQTTVTGPNLTMAPKPEAAQAPNIWEPVAGEVKRLRHLKAVLGITQNEGLLAYIREFFGSNEVNIHSVTPDNIADFNHFLDSIIADNAANEVG